MKRLKPGTARKLCWDDSEWSRVLERCLVGDPERVRHDLAWALEPATLRTFHGCRTDDAWSYFKNGLLRNDPNLLAQKLTAIVSASPQHHDILPHLPGAIARFMNHDTGLVYLSAEGDSLVKDAPHYCIYGSEWMMAVLAPLYCQDVLKQVGTPTLLEVDLPLNLTTYNLRKAFAENILAEWTRLVCNRTTWHAPIDFTFTLDCDIPASAIITHSHPAKFIDYHDHGRIYRSPTRTCAFCATSASPPDHIN